MQHIAQKVKERTGVNTTVRDIENIMSALCCTGDFYELIRLSNEPFVVVVETLEVLIDEKLVELTDRGYLAISQRGREFVKNHNIKPISDHICSNCGGRGIQLGDFKSLLLKFKEITCGRPVPVAEYDQGYVTEETAVARIALMADRGDLDGKDIIILGDDDLVSIAAALSGLPARVTVLEVDERIVRFIDDVALKYNLPIETRIYDLSKKLPDEYVGKFDTFITDPPDTLEALKLFVKRGIASLKGVRCAGYFGVTSAEASFNKWYELQAALLAECHVVITDIIHNFNHYMNWDYLPENFKGRLPFLKQRPSNIWYCSSMYRVETVGIPDTANDDVSDTRQLYVDRESIV
ncbi:bis-aminopropyl spermidine synthase family protein [Caldanaerobius polysaccharolyticus]|uniref:bis-aminopropyl spermidine synthase family protein n=1 Tax=Caldanaerobius polysaccharolyticus TaxID=44256 RepID=UPI00047E25AD|nr:bis-aminopropyl spermidine synthase family protein [Caldanaerobius polysaccharolyticus]